MKPIFTAIVLLMMVAASGCKSVNAPTIATGSHHSCAIDEADVDNKQVKCWGEDRWGKSFSQPPLLKNPKSVSAGRYTACAIDDNGYTCWGETSGFFMPVSEKVKRPLVMELNEFHGCVIQNAEVICWGANGDHQTEVPLLSNPFDVSVGMFHSCAIDDSGVICWGEDSQGQIAVPSLINPIDVAAGRQHTCAIDDNGVSCWGYPNDSGVARVPESMVNPTAISAGDGVTCGIGDRVLSCWGWPDWNNIVSDMPAITNATQVSVREDHACVVTLDRAVVCWGKNASDAPAITPVLSAHKTMISTGEE